MSGRIFSLPMHPYLTESEIDRITEVIVLRRGKREAAMTVWEDRKIHPSAEVSEGCAIGPGTSVWNNAQIREGARIGAGCNIGKDVYIDTGAVIGDRVKIQNGVSVYRGVTLGTTYSWAPR